MCCVFTQLIATYTWASRNALYAPKRGQGLGYVLALSSRVGDIVERGSVGELPECWITMPWAPLRRLPCGARRVDVRALLSKKELWRAFLDAMKATYLLFRRKRTSKWVLQSYTARLGGSSLMDKLPGRLVMAEHYDRLGGAS